MATPYCEAAIAIAQQNGNALLKYVSPNDVNATGAHQWGFYLPKADGVWQMFTEHPPVKGTNNKASVSIRWQLDQYETKSAVTWYGKGTRSEYRLTRFGRNFPFLTIDSVGDLLVLIPFDHHHFRAFLLHYDDDIEELQAALGVQITESWAVFQNGVPRVETENDCIEREFREFVQTLTNFPTGRVFSDRTRAALRACIENFNALNADKNLVRSMDSEYHLYRMAERLLCQPEIVRVFRDVDDFLTTAATIMNRRKSRAGRSLENHVESLLTERDIPHEMRPDIDGRPDIVIPHALAYLDIAYPLDRLFIVGVKTTCKDRWRQVLNEARRVPHKHILTMQPGISASQLREMHEANVTLVVPDSLHKDYPRNTPIELLNIEQFITSVRTSLQQ